MALSQTAFPAALNRYLLIAFALLLAFGIASFHLARDSLWFDEGYSMYVVRDSDSLTSHQPTAIARHIVNSLRDTLARTRADVHPPLYFVLLDVWTLSAGESVYVVRLLSTFFGLIGLSATYALGKRLADHQTGFIALLVLATASMFVYYTRETRMYTLLLALSVLATLAYVRWSERSSVGRTLIYGGTLTALMLTQYVGGFIALTHGLHLLLTQPRRIGRMLFPTVIALVLYAPWLPALYWQYTTHGGAAAIPFDDLHTAVAALIFFVTGGYWGLYVLPILAGLVSRRFSLRTPTVMLLVLWLFITPLLLLLLNDTIRALFQVRYNIAILPAGALLVAFGIRSLTNKQWASRIGHQLARMAAFILLSTLLYTQITIYPFVWNPKPDWQAAIERMVAARQSLEPAITLIPEIIPAANYARQHPVRQGISLDLGWRWQESYDMATYVDHVGSAESVWLVMPSTFVSTWDATRELLATRHIGYRDSVMNLVLYRFDSGAGDDLQFTFADRLAYNGGIRHQLFAVPGEDFCFTVTLDVLVDLERDYAADFYLTQGYGTIRSIITQSIGQPTAGEELTLESCLPISLDNPSGPHHVRMRVYHPETNQALPLLEQGEVYWSDELVFALVSVG